jgi:hypothetical protein
MTASTRLTGAGDRPDLVAQSDHSFECRNLLHAAGPGYVRSAWITVGGLRPEIFDCRKILQRVGADCVASARIKSAHIPRFLTPRERIALLEQRVAGRGVIGFSCGAEGSGVGGAIVRSPIRTSENFTIVDIVK